MSKNEKQDGDIATPDEVVESDQVTADEMDPAERTRQTIASLSDKLLRAQAEQQNVMKRAEQRVTEAVRYANADLVKSLIDTIDDFERTLDHAQSADVESVRQGVKLIYEKFVKVLAANRVEAIDPGDEPFDPHCHEALMQQPSADKPANTILQVVQRGFRLHDRVLRPAKVIVSAGGQQETESQE